MDLNYFLNKMLFLCAAKPGLSSVLLDIINFEGQAIRCRPAHQLHDIVGKTMEEAIIGSNWVGSVVIGIIPAKEVKSHDGLAPDRFVVYAGGLRRADPGMFI